MLLMLLLLLQQHLVMLLLLLQLQLLPVTPFCQPFEELPSGAPAVTAAPRIPTGAGGIFRAAPL